MHAPRDEEKLERKLVILATALGMLLVGVLAFAGVLRLPSADGEAGMVPVSSSSASSGGGSNPLCPFTVHDGSSNVLFTIGCDGSLQGAGSFPEFFVGQPFLPTTPDWDVTASAFGAVPTIYPDGGANPFEASYESAMPAGFDAMLNQPGAFICWDTDPTVHTHCLRSLDGGAGTTVMDLTGQRVTRAADGVNPTDLATVEQIANGDPYWDDAGFNTPLGVQTVNNRNFPGQYIVGDGTQTAPVAAPLALQSHVNNGPMITGWDNNNRGFIVQQSGLDIQFEASANACAALAADQNLEGTSFRACSDHTYTPIPAIFDGGVNVGIDGTIASVLSITGQVVSSGSGIVVNSKITDGAVHIGTLINTANTLSNASAVLLDVTNNSVPEFTVSPSGVAKGFGGLDSNTQKVTNVLAGTVSTDGVNLGQLQLAHTNVSGSIGTIALGTLGGPATAGEWHSASVGTLDEFTVTFWVGNSVSDVSCTFDVFDVTASAQLTTITNGKCCTTGAATNSTTSTSGAIAVAVPSGHQIRVRVDDDGAVACTLTNVHMNAYIHP